MSSADSQPSSSSVSGREMLLVVLALLVLGITAAACTYSHGSILYYGDAQSHLNISRSIVDSRTPGYEQLGTVWLPLLHLVCLPFVSNNFLWSTGLAGTIPILFAFVVAGVCLYGVARTSFAGVIPALVLLACFALNPNVLYLASIPMTEILFIAALALWLLCFVQFAKTNTRAWFFVAVAASWAMSLCRYDGWFLIPFEALWLAGAARKGKLAVFVSFAAAAALVPVYWSAHNWYEAGNALDFFNGPYSAKAIQGGRPYPGWHDWPRAILYYAAAGELCSGWSLALVGLTGLVLSFLRGRVGITGFLCLTPIFYIWSLHSSQNPIFVPQLYPHGYYNSRYGVAIVVLAAVCAGVLAEMLPLKWNKAALLLPLISILPWLLHPDPHRWICWEESNRNSIARRAWNAQTAAYMAAHYQPGEGILTVSGTGDISGSFAAGSLPLREVLHIGNGPAWTAATSRPDLVHPAAWAIAQKGDAVSRLLTRFPSSPYHLARVIEVPGAPAVEIYSRSLVSQVTGKR